ncbi:MAG TPA: hypothetical protein VNE67_04870, partial [Acetobacteraceae bacterium]|nr:hypothetical protein [Acetobacteraceae bacterium]
MAVITIPGAGASVVSGSFNNSYNQTIAQQIASALAAAVTNGTRAYSTVSGSSAVAAPSGAASANELIVTGGGDYTVAAGPGGSVADYTIVLDTTAAVTINGAPAETIFGGAGPLTVIDSHYVALGDSGAGAGANDVVSLSGSDANAYVAGNNGNDTLTAAG